MASGESNTALYTIQCIYVIVCVSGRSKTSVYGRIQQHNLFEIGEEAFVTKAYLIVLYMSLHVTKWGGAAMEILNTLNHL